MKKVKRYLPSLFFLPCQVLMLRESSSYMARDRKFWVPMAVKPQQWDGRRSFRAEGCNLQYPGATLLIVNSVS